MASAAELAYTGIVEALARLDDGFVLRRELAAATMGSRISAPFRLLPVPTR